MARTNLTAELLKGVVSYDPISGSFARIKLTIKRGILGPVHTINNRYRVISLWGRSYHVRRLIWLYMTGEWPKGQVDHIDGNRLNNAFSNLRDIPGAAQQQNYKRARSDNSVGLLGVSKHAGRYRAQIVINGKRTHIGLYDDPNDAHAAYVAAKRRLHPYGTL